LPAAVTIPEPNEFAKQRGYRPFPPRWEKWLSAVRSAILAAQPVPGRHVTTDEHPGKGTVINVLDTSDRGGPPTGPPTGDCPCALPAGDCPHALCFEFNPDEQILVDGYYDAGAMAILSLSNTDKITVYPYIYDSGGGSFLAGVTLSVAGTSSVYVEVPMTLAAFFGHWHGVSVKITPSNVELCAYGSYASSGLGNVINADQLFIGSASAYPGAVGLSIRGIQLLYNPSSDPLESSFNFDAVTDPFDSTIGTGQTASGNVVRIDSSDAAKNGYIKHLDPPYNLKCDGCVHVRAKVTFYGYAKGCGFYFPLDGSLYMDQDTPTCVGGTWSKEWDNDSTALDTAGIIDCTGYGSICFSNYFNLQVVTTAAPAVVVIFGSALGCDDGTGCCAENFGSITPSEIFPISDVDFPFGYYNPIFTVDYGGGNSANVVVEVWIE
jgi:hypothetical protein